MSEKIGNTVVFGIFDSRSQVESAIDLLKVQGFRNSDISVLMADPKGTRDLAHEKNTKAPEGATAGAAGGALLGGAVGGISGALIGLGIPEYEAKRYEGYVKDGGVLLSVHADSSDWTKRAKELLNNCGARDIASTTEERGKKREEPKSDRSSQYDRP